VRRGNALNLQNLAIHNTRRRRQTANPVHIPPVQAAAPGAPGGGDSPPPSDSGRVSDPRSSPSLSGRSSESSLQSSNGSRRAYVVRDELQRLSVASSPAFEGGQQAANPMVDNIHSDLVRLSEIMLELRRSGQEDGDAANGIPPELERQIEQLFEQVRNNLRAIGNPDEQILRGSNINSMNASGETGLHIAARKRPVDVAAIRKFLNLGASVLVKDHQLNTPLLALFTVTYTSDQNLRDALKLLLDAGSDINAKANDGWTALSRVAEFARFTELESLVTLGADVNTSTVDLLTPLHRAAKYPLSSGVGFLLSRSANPNVISESGQTPLSLVCQLTCSHGREQATIVELLLAAGANPTACPPGPKRPLDAVIKVLKDQESSLKLQQMDAGKISSFGWVRGNLEHALYTINILLRHLNTITLHYTTRASVRSMYAFRSMPNIEAIPIVELRRRFRERIGQIVVLTNRELYDDIRRTV
jgi:ankyrin repeat protein